MDHWEKNEVHYQRCLDNRYFSKLTAKMARNSSLCVHVPLPGNINAIALRVLAPPIMHVG